MNSAGVCPSEDANPTRGTQPGAGRGLVVAEHVLTHRRGQRLVLLSWDPVWTAEDWAAEDQPSAAQGLRVYTESTN